MLMFSGEDLYAIWTREPPWIWPEESLGIRFICIEREHCLYSCHNVLSLHVSCLFNVKKWTKLQWLLDKKLLECTLLKKLYTKTVLGLKINVYISLQKSKAKMQSKFGKIKYDNVTVFNVHSVVMNFFFELKTPIRLEDLFRVSTDLPMMRPQSFP